MCVDTNPKTSIVRLPVEGTFTKATNNPDIRRLILSGLEPEDVVKLSSSSRTFRSDFLKERADSLISQLEGATSSEKMRNFSREFRRIKLQLDAANNSIQDTPIFFRGKGEKLVHESAPLSFWTRYRAYKHDFSSDLLRISEIYDLFKRFNEWYERPLDDDIAPVRRQWVRNWARNEGAECYIALHKLVENCYKKETAIIENARFQALLFRIMWFFENLFYPHSQSDSPNLPSLTSEDRQYRSVPFLPDYLPKFSQSRTTLELGKMQDVRFDDGKVKQVRFSFRTDSYNHMKIYIVDPSGCSIGYIALTKQYTVGDRRDYADFSEHRDNWQEHSGRIEPARLHAEINIEYPTDYDYYYAILLQVAVEVFHREKDFPLLCIQCCRRDPEILVPYGFDLYTEAKTRAVSERVRQVRTEERAPALFVGNNLEYRDYGGLSVILTRKQIRERPVFNKMDCNQATSWEEILKTTPFFGSIKGRILPAALDGEFARRFLNS